MTPDRTRPCNSARALVYLLCGMALAVGVPRLAVAASFVAFESGPVRPLALSADGLHLYAVNIPDNRLEIFQVGETSLVHVASVPVGMEPVAVAARRNDEAWVVNHLSDSVSVVEISPGLPRVTRTLAVGDEPRDIVFAGPGRDRAFITTANRNLPRTRDNPEGTADVWVFDAQNPGDQAGGVPLTIVNLFGEVPRALAVSPDGETVYAGVLYSGNQTSVVGELTVQGDLPPPLTNFEGAPAPNVGLIVRFDGNDWIDAAGRPWPSVRNLVLPDWDVFELDADAPEPRQSGRYAGVGTVLYNISVNPQSGNVYVSNTEARNIVRFEGPGEFGGSTVRGHFAENRITVIANDNVLPRHLNKHIDYDTFPGTPEENAKSLALPLQMEVTADGSTLYVAAFGSSKVGVFDVDALESDSFTPSEDDHIELSGGGPGGLALDEAHERLYVLTRFDNSISIVDLATRTETAHLSLYNPEPESLVTGRRFLYDARHTSSRGDSACASCHVFGDVDGLAWDLGNPDGVVAENPNPFLRRHPGIPIDFHPMKGPMTTQSLRGLANNGPMHWRGDRTGGSLPGGDPRDEQAAFEQFNVAFEGLLGREAPLSDAEMESFAKFALQLTYPPNPIRALDNTLTPAQARGLASFTNFSGGPGVSECAECHARSPAQGFFGTAGFSVTRPTSSIPLKIPHLRNVYTKEGIVGELGGGPEIRGFGLAHDGTIKNLMTLLQGFEFPGGDPQRRDVQDFLLAFDSDMMPIVGAQVTVTATNLSSALPRLQLLIARSNVTQPRRECDLIVKGSITGEARGLLHTGNSFRSDRVDDPPRSTAALLLLARQPGQELTFTCVPPDSGQRMGIDRDEDGYLDRDELDAGSDPADPRSVPTRVPIADSRR